MVDVDGIFDAGAEITFEETVGDVGLAIFEVNAVGDDVERADVKLRWVFVTLGDGVEDALSVKVEHWFVILEVDKKT